MIAPCDVNAHHICWRSCSIRTRGSKLLVYLVDTKLQILKLGNEPTFYNAVTQEVMNITTASPDIACQRVVGIGRYHVHSSQVHRFLNEQGSISNRFHSKSVEDREKLSKGGVHTIRQRRIECHDGTK